jgi:hypothetical protein
MIGCSEAEREDAEDTPRTLSGNEPMSAKLS